MLRELGGTLAFGTKINPIFKKYRGRVQQIFGCSQNYETRLSGFPGWPRKARERWFQWRKKAQKQGMTSLYFGSVRAFPKKSRLRRPSGRLAGRGRPSGRLACRGRPSGRSAVAGGPEDEEQKDYCLPRAPRPKRKAASRGSFPHHQLSQVFCK